MALVITSAIPKNPSLHHFTTIHRTIPSSVIGFGSFSTNAKPIKVSNFNSNSTKLSIKNNFGAFSQTLEAEKQEGQNLILKQPRKEVFFGRKWNFVVVLSMHALSLFAPFHFNWPAFRVAGGLGVVTGLGITLSYHRNLSHKSFKLPKWLEYSFAYCGLLALQGNPIEWVRIHRYHHQFCDSDRDPHSPLEGFWFSHMNWLFVKNSAIERYGEPNNVVDLEKQSFYRFLRSSYFFHPLALGTLLYAIGGFPFLVWGMGVRTIYVYHITWLVNSVCHMWGNQPWNTRDLSRNNWWVALLALGEGWHNNHHAFEYSARQGLEWWQIDLTWYVVRLLQAIGLATEVKVPTEIQKQRMALNNNDAIAI